MSNSLQDQLLKAGLIDKKKAKDISKDQRKEKKQKNKGTVDSPNPAQLAAKQAIEEKKQRDKELNRQRQDEAEKKALLAQVAQMVSHYQVKSRGGDIAYNFNHLGKVKRIFVSQAISDEIAQGRLCIASVGENYALVPKPVADKIRERSTDSIIVYNDNNKEKTEFQKGSDEEYYAQFEIPDDLAW